MRISDWSSDVCSSDLFEQGLDALDERSGVEAVDDAVIERRRQIHHRAQHDLSVLDDWSLDQLVDADNRNFRCVDHRSGDDAAERAETGDRDSRTAPFLTCGFAINGKKDRQGKKVTVSVNLGGRCLIKTK